MGILQTDNATRDHKVEEIEVHRTVEGTLFEAVCAVLIIIMWIITLVQCHSLADQLSNPFNEAAREDASYQRAMLIVMALIATGVAIYALYSAYHPLTKVNFPITITTATQQAMIVRLVRIISVELCVCFIGVAALPEGSICAAFSTVVLPITIILYRYKLSKAKNTVNGNNL